MVRTVLLTGVTAAPFTSRPEAEAVLRIAVPGEGAASAVPGSSSPIAHASARACARARIRARDHCEWRREPRDMREPRTPRERRPPDQVPVKRRRETL